MTKPEALPDGVFWAYVGTVTFGDVERVVIYDERSDDEHA